MTRLPKEDASITITPSGVVDEGIRVDGVDEDTGGTWASRKKGTFWGSGVWLFDLVEDTVGVFDSSNSTCLEM